MKQLTELAIRNAKPAERDISLREKNGLVVRVRPSGSKTFYYIYRFDGKQKRLTLGTWPAVSLAEAREKHLEALLKLKRGEDPGAGAQKQVEVEDPDTPENLTCARLVRLYLGWSQENHVKAWHNTQDKALAKDFLNDYGQRRAAEIKNRDAIYIAEKLADKPGTARNLVKALRGAWEFAKARNYVEYNPFAEAGVVKNVPRMAPVPRQRWLSEAEIKLLWSAIDAGGGSDSTRRALKLILVTAQRPGEVAGMSWQEIQVGEGRPFCQTCRRCGWWTIPGERREKARRNSEGRGSARPHRVYLSPLAMSLINGSTDTTYICPTDGLEAGHVLVNSINYHVRREVPGTGKIKYYGLPRWTPHDLRRTAGTHLGALDALPPEVEQILGHALPGLSGTYNLHTYDALKRRWLGAWGEYLQNLLA